MTPQEAKQLTLIKFSGLGTVQVDPAVPHVETIMFHDADRRSFYLMSYNGTAEIGNPFAKSAEEMGLVLDKELATRLIVTLAAWLDHGSLKIVKPAVELAEEPPLERALKLKLMSLEPNIRP